VLGKNDNEISILSFPISGSLLDSSVHGEKIINSISEVLLSECSKTCGVLYDLNRDVSLCLVVVSLGSGRWDIGGAHSTLFCVEGIGLTLLGVQFFG